MALQLTLSCDLDKSQSGPTLIHSTGVQDYKIPPEVIRILQENCSNDRLADHAEGVICEEGPQRILDILRRNGFTLQNQTTDEQKALWTLVQGGGGGGGGHQPVSPPAPHPTPSGENQENEADAGGEDQGGEDEGEGKEEEEEGEDEPEQ